MPKLEFENLIHATRGDNSPIQMLKHGFLEPSKTFEEYNTDYPDSQLKALQPFVYCHYMFSGLHHNCKKDYAWNYLHTLLDTKYKEIIFVIDMSIIKELPFYACASMSYGECVTNKSKLFMQSKGNLKRKPNLERIRNYIQAYIQYVENYFPNVKCNRYIRYSYIQSHEFLFHRIPVKYITKILVWKQYRNDRDILELEQYIKENGLNIEVVYYNTTEQNYEKYFR